MTRHRTEPVRGSRFLDAPGAASSPNYVPRRLRAEAGVALRTTPAAEPAQGSPALPAEFGVYAFPHPAEYAARRLAAEASDQQPSTLAGLFAPVADRPRLTV